MRLRLALLLSFFLGACGDGDRLATSACKVVISEHLVQPWSAKFENVQVQEKTNGGEIEGWEVSMQVTAKNRLGELNTQNATCKVDRTGKVTGLN